MKKHLSFHSLLLRISLFSIFYFQFSICEAQPIQNGDKFWDGAIFYKASTFSSGAVDLVGKDINGDEYSISLIWNEDKNEYSVFSRNGAIALRVNEGARVKKLFIDRVSHFLVFYNDKGDAAWTLRYFLNADLQSCTLMERNLEQMPTSEVITTYLLNTTWLARFPKEELRLMRNEILARHGWNFQSKDLQDHFKKEKWYKPVKDNNTVVLSDLERTNLELIKAEESTPDEYRYSMLSPDMFPGGLADDGRGPEEINGVQTYTVTNEREFLNALGPNRTIVIAKNVHLNLSRVLENESLFTNNPSRRWIQSGDDFIGTIPLVISEGETDGQQLDLVNIDNLTIRGAGNASIEVAPRYSYCLYFINCNTPATLTSAYLPDVDMKYYLDMQFNLLANDPALKGAGMTGNWGSNYADNEMVRWTGRLFRHYCIEGRREPLAPKYGFTYKLPFVTNPDFNDGMKGWKVEGNITPGHTKGYAVYQKRWACTAGIGDNYAVLNRGEKPNRLSQKLKGVKAGRYYKLQYITADAEDVTMGKGGRPYELSVDVQIEGAKFIPEETLCYKATRSPRKIDKNMYKVNLDQRIFKAEKDDPLITFSDEMVKPGRKTAVNYISLTPYFREE